MSSDANPVEVKLGDEKKYTNLEKFLRWAREHGAEICGFLDLRTDAYALVRLPLSKAPRKAHYKCPYLGLKFSSCWGDLRPVRAWATGVKGRAWLARATVDLGCVAGAFEEASIFGDEAVVLGDDPQVREKFC